MRKFVVTVVALAGVLATPGAFAQGTAPPGGVMPMQSGTTPPAQATPMQGMTQGQPGGMAMGCCPMMQRAATVDSRLRQLEERAGIASPPAQPAAPHTAH